MNGIERLARIVAGSAIALGHAFLGRVIVRVARKDPEPSCGVHELSSSIAPLAGSGGMLVSWSLAA